MYDDKSWKSFAKFAIGLSVACATLCSLMVGMVLGPAALKLIIPLTIFIFVVMMLGRAIVDGVEYICRRLSHSSTN